MLSDIINQIDRDFPRDTFGVELECIPGVRSNDIETIADALSNAGISTRAESYNHTTQRHWKVTTDASIVSDLGGFEIVSPVLRGGDGIRQLERVLDVLNRRGVKVNRTCGLHVHIGATQLQAADIKHLFKRYGRHEVAIDAIMPPSRRGNTNRYCRSMATLIAEDSDTMQRIESARDTRSVAAVFSGHDQRYMKLNIASYLRHGTVEFRQHSGTLEINKIASWVLFCLNFVKNSCISPTTRTVEQNINIPFSRTSKAYRLYQMLSNGGVSAINAAEMLDTTPENIQSIISTQIRRRMGVHVTKTNDIYRIHVPLVQEEVPAAPTSDQTPFDGLPASVVQFFSERREHLHGRRLIRQ